MVAAEIAEPLGDALLELGALSVTVEDASAGGYDESPLYGEPGLAPDLQAWERSTVTALFSPLPNDVNDEPMAILNALTAAGFTLTPPQVKMVAEQDWVRLTQSQFEPIQIGQRIWIVPSWHEAPTDPSAICLALDPGLAFGTGSHPTTRLCLQWLESQFNLYQRSLLDYGCGSGILAIAAKKLGCEPVLGIDIDPQAIIAATSNAEINHEAVDFVLPDSANMVAPAQFDIVMANILANPLQVLAPLLISRLRPGGHLILSGILARQATEISATYSQWLALTVAGESEGWVCMHGILPLKLDPAVSRSPIHSPKKSWPLYALLSSLLALLLLVGGSHLFRAPLLRSLAPQVDEKINPLTNAAFTAALKVNTLLCKFLSCKETPIEAFEAWKIDSASLGMENKNNVAKEAEIDSILSFELQNRLLLPVTWPNMELTLSDTAENILSRIELPPAAWLPTQFQTDHADYLQTGASAGLKVSCGLPLKLPAQAAGYRLRIVYP
jgi:ribosomal protein L11 methyltransferase